MAVSTGGPHRIDWEAVERSPEFQELSSKRRRFVVPATIFFLAWYIGFVLLAGYAQDFMGERSTRASPSATAGADPVRDGLGARPGTSAAPTGCSTRCAGRRRGPGPGRVAARAAGPRRPRPEARSR